MAKYIGSGGVLSVILSIAGCSTPTLIVKSDPTGAQFLLVSTGIKGVTDQTVVLPPETFGANSVRDESILYEKEGYRARTVKVTLRDGAENITDPEVITLEPLTTKLSITSSPPGALVMFDIDDEGLQQLLGMTREEFRLSGWKTSFVTPQEFTCTENEAKALSDRLKIKAVQLEGYWLSPVQDPRSGFALGKAIKLKLGETTQISISLVPIVTSLKVMTDPPAAAVEDLTEAGFGFLGETPLSRDFPWLDVVLWGERKGINRNRVMLETVSLTLKVSKVGYLDDVFDVKIPVGQERAFKKNLKPVPARIAFESDPPGANVYVKRRSTERQWDPAASAFRDVSVEVNKHLGTTPFTLNSDPTDPLIHGEVVQFEKTGYESAQAYYALGLLHYHVTLHPKSGAGENPGEK